MIIRLWPVLLCWAWSAHAQVDDAPVIVPPEVIAQAEPIYPEDCQREGISGVVQMEIDIDDEGLVSFARVLSSPDLRLGYAALGAITQLQTIPAREVSVDGERTIAVRILTSLTFELAPPSPPPATADEPKEQPVNLSGRVFIKGSPQTLSGASVVVLLDRNRDDDDRQVFTDEQGSFSFRGVPTGPQRMIVESNNFATGIIDIDIANNEATDVVVYLEQQSSGNETIVREKRTQREVTKRVLTQRELTRVPGTFGDALRVVQRLPGVSRPPFGLGAILVRGGSPEDSVILIDGHWTRLLFHLGAGPSVLNNDLVEKLEFYPGGQGARFGRAIAGAVEVITRDPKSDGTSAKATIDLLQAGFKLEGPLTDDGKLSFFVAGRSSYVTEVLRIANTVGGGIASWFDAPFSFLNLSPRYGDYQAKLFWQMPALLPAAKMTLSLNVLGSHDDLDFALDSSQLGPAAPSNIGLTIGFHRLNPVWRVTSTDRNDDGSAKWSAYVSPMVEYQYNENRFDSSQFGLNLQRASVRAEVEMRPWSSLGLRIGLDDIITNYQTIADLPNILPTERLFPRPATSDPTRFYNEDQVTSASNAFYIDSDVHLGDLTLLLGARAELTSYYDQQRISLDPRLAARWQLLPFTTIKGNIGRYSQAGTPFALSKGVGNPDMPLERGFQFGIGAETWLTRSLDVDVQLFFRNAFDLAESVGSPISFTANGAKLVQAIGEERAFGAEFLLRQRLDNGWFGWISYTLLRAEERANRPEGIEGAKERPWRATEFDQTHILSIAGSTELPWGFEVGAAFRYVTGNPTTYAQRGIYDADTSTFRRVNGPTRAGRLPAFVQLDLRVDKRIVFDQWALSLFLDLQNATNQQNYEIYQYNYDFTTVQGFPGLPILPVIGADASF